MLEPFPNINEVVFKDKFVERYSKLTDFEAFRKHSLSYPRKSIRVNTLKISVADLKKRLSNNWKLTQIPWCKEGFWIEGERRDIGNLPEHVLGYIYVQEAASMIPPIVLQPEPGEIILDMCAAPGSKTTQIAQYMKNEGVLVTNDLTVERLAALAVNVQRMGITNEIITRMPGHRFKEFEFDRILVDAPCSGTGTINKSIKTIEMWNPDMVRRLSANQKQLLVTAFNNLKQGGTIVYSTCTMEPEEDECVVDFLVNKYGAKVEKIDLDIKRSEPITEFEGKTYSDEVKKCLRIWPQDNGTEGFFVAKLRKV